MDLAADGVTEALRDAADGYERTRDARQLRRALLDLLRVLEDVAAQ